MKDRKIHGESNMQNAVKNKKRAKGVMLILV